MEITQFTYFQEIGGIELNPITVELTYGTERIAMYLQQVNNVFDLAWNDSVTYGDIHHETEVQFSTYNFEEGDVAMLMATFQSFERECKRLLANRDKRERTGYIARVRALARQCAERYIEERAAMGHPLLNRRTESDGAKTSGIRSKALARRP
jgi:glycyl-tRNA synthetase alpha chain